MRVPSADGAIHVRATNETGKLNRPLSGQRVACFIAQERSEVMVQHEPYILYIGKHPQIGDRVGALKYGEVEREQVVVILLVAGKSLILFDPALLPHEVVEA